MEDTEPIDIATLPGYALFAQEYQRLLAGAAAGRLEDRVELLARTREAVAVLVERELLQFVYLPNDREEGANEEDEDDDVAWFSVDGVEVDEQRDAVMLIGDVTHLYGGPITLEGVDDGQDSAV